MALEHMHNAFMKYFLSLSSHSNFHALLKLFYHGELTAVVLAVLST